jgi:hypothetical protein
MKIGNNIHLFIVSLFFLYFIGKDLLDKLLKYFLGKYGDLYVFKVLVYITLPFSMLYCFFNFNTDSLLIYHFFFYVSSFALIYMYRIFKNIDEFMHLNSDKKINCMTLFRELKAKKIIDGKYISFLCFLRQSELGKNDKLIWNDFEGEGRFIYKKIFSLCLLCHLEPEKNFNDLKLSFYSEKLEPYFIKPDNSPLSISSDNVSKFTIKGDKNFNFMKAIFEKCITK